MKLRFGDIPVRFPADHGDYLTVGDLACCWDDDDRFSPHVLVAKDPDGICWVRKLSGWRYRLWWWKRRVWSKCLVSDAWMRCFFWFLVSCLRGRPNWWLLK